MPSGCPSEPITAESIPYLSPEELDLCLSSDFLIKNLEAVLNEPISLESSKILKKKVDQVRGDTGQEPPSSTGRMHCGNRDQ